MTILWMSRTFFQARNNDDDDDLPILTMIKNLCYGHIESASSYDIGHFDPDSIL
jgi:hypothetical protein